MGERGVPDLAALLILVIEANRERIDAAAVAHPDQPIEVTFHWHPFFGKVEPIIRPSVRLPPFRVGEP